MMGALSVFSPYPYFPDNNGYALEGGNIYIGANGLSPLAPENRIAVYWDETLTVPAAQPIRTIAGMPSLNGRPGRIFVDADDYSIVVKNKNGVDVYSSLSAAERNPAFSGARSSIVDEYFEYADFYFSGGSTFVDTDSALTVGLNNIILDVSGVIQRHGVDYTVTDSNTIKIIDKVLTVSDYIFAKIYLPTATDALYAQNLQYTPDTGVYTSTTTIKAFLDRFVSAVDYPLVNDFISKTADAVQKLKQIDIFASATNWVQFLLGDRGLVIRPVVTDSRTTLNVIPNGTPSGSNTSYGTIRVWGQDIEDDPTGSRTSINMEMHYDSDEALRCRFATRSEGTPALPHPDFYWQINGSNGVYIGRKKDGTTGRTNFGIFPRGYAFVTSVTTFWAASTAVSIGDKRLLAKSDFLYLECTTGGTTGGTEPTPTNAGTTGLADGSVVWSVKSRLYLAGSTESTEAIPAIWGNEDGNTGYGNLNPQASHHFTGLVRLDDGFRLVNGSVTGATVTNILTGSFNSSFGGSIAAGGSATASVTITGAAVGDIVSMGLPNANMIAGLVYNAWVDATNSVRIRVTNITGSPIATTTQTYKVMVTKTS